MNDAPVGEGNSIAQQYSRYYVMITTPQLVTHCAVMITIPQYSDALCMRQQEGNPIANQQCSTLNGQLYVVAACSSLSAHVYVMQAHDP